MLPRAAGGGEVGVDEVWGSGCQLGHISAAWPPNKWLSHCLSLGFPVCGAGASEASDWGVGRAGAAASARPEPHGAVSGDRASWPRALVGSLSPGAEGS